MPPRLAPPARTTAEVLPDLQAHELADERQAMSRRKVYYDEDTEEAIELQVAVLLELAAQPFDGTTDDGRKNAGEWFNAQRFRNRADDFGIYTDVVSEAIAANSEEKLAAELEGK
jgi:hypothetical protein